MKHNTCVMRGRSLHRRILIQEETAAWEGQYKLDGPHHSRQGSRDSQRSRSSRQGSREGSTHHSRQGSRDASNGSTTQSRTLEESKDTTHQTLAKTAEKLQNTNIEIYATLPKKKVKKPQEKLTTSITSRKDHNHQLEIEKISHKDKKNSLEKKDKKKSKKSEDSDYASDHSHKKSPSRKNEDDINAIIEVKDDKNLGKKQHKIRRKLLMGGLIRRKNRSMPDLREGQESENEKHKAQDDFEVRSLSRPTTPSEKSIGGYLSEGHFDFSNPNMERSKLMRKSFHGSVGKGLSPAKNVTGLKVPPPIPQRTTSQLTMKASEKSKSDEKKVDKKPPYPLPIYANGQALNPPPALPPRCYTPEIPNQTSATLNMKNMKEHHSLPYMRPTEGNNQYINQQSYSYNVQPYQENPNLQKPGTPTQITILADVHQEQKLMEKRENERVNENNNFHQSSISNDVINNNKQNSQPISHSRQSSEDFPPPPPPLEEALEDLRNLGLLPSSQEEKPQEVESFSLLSQLQKKSQQLKSNGEISNLSIDERVNKTSGSPDRNWLQELQAKQAALKKKTETGNGELRHENAQTENTNPSVKSLTSKFENSKQEEMDEVDGPRKSSNAVEIKQTLSTEMFTREYTQCNSLTFPSHSGQESRLISGYKTGVDVTQQQSSQQNEELDLNTSTETASSEEKIRKKKMKKSVTFCDQVVLVATAEDEEEDAYIPNPILERVLKSALTACTTDSVDGAPKLSSVQRVGTPQSSPQSGQKSHQPSNVQTSKMEYSHQPTVTSAPNQPQLQAQPTSVHANGHHHQQATSTPFSQPRLPPPYQPPPNVSSNITTQKPMAALSQSSQSLAQQQQSVPSSHTLPNGLSTGQMPHLIPTNNTSPQKTNGNNSMYHPAQHSHHLPGHYYPQIKQNHLHNQTTPNMFNHNTSGTLPFPTQHHIHPQANHRHHPNQYVPTHSSVNHQHPSHSQNVTHPPTHQHNTQHPHSPYTHRHNHPSNTQQSQYGLRHNLSGSSVQNQQHNRPSHIPGPGMMTRQHSSLGFSHSHSSQQEQPQNTSNTAKTSQTYSPYQRVPHPNQSTPFPQTQSAPRLTLPGYSTQPSVNGYSTGKTSADSHKVPGQGFSSMHRQQSKPINNGVSSSGPQVTNTTPTHFSGPLDPSAIYTTVNKATKLPKTSNSKGTAIQPCNLCRKKAVNHPSIYCSDCNFYMSRFKPKV